jgi:hypothetical protein
MRNKTLFKAFKGMFFGAISDYFRFLGKNRRILKQNEKFNNPLKSIE